MPGDIRGLRVIALCVVLAASGPLALRWWRNHNIGPVQRGAALASAHGCLACHGPAGRLADPDGSRGIGSVPSFTHEDVTTYAKTPAEIREWILDGGLQRLEAEAGAEAPAVLRMPAWQDTLSAGQVDDLVAYVRAVSDFDALPAAVVAARDTAARLGCFTCHGPQGRGDTPNRGSLKGYIPSWSGADFPEQASDDGEIREWIRDGAPRRLRENPVAAFFMRRQLLRMPAFGKRVSEEELQQLAAYIRWLRSAEAR